MADLRRHGYSKRRRKVAPSLVRTTPMESFEAQLTTTAIPAGRITLHGNLHVPPDPQGLVLFAHVSGSSRHSPRHQRVAEFLHDVSLATLLFDLLSPDEEPSDAFNARLRFDIPLLAQRL